MIFYFTATGNSLYAARYLEKELVSIPQALSGGNLSFKADRIRIVCPVYGHEVPGMVREFLEKATFDTEYFYMVLTYGNRHGGRRNWPGSCAGNAGSSQIISMF